MKLLRSDFLTFGKFTLFQQLLFSYQNKVNDHAPECGEVDVQLAVRGHVADQKDAGGKTKRLFFYNKDNNSGRELEK